MQHYTEHILELYVLNAKEIQSQQQEIEEHLSECYGCMSLVDEIREFYSAMNEQTMQQSKPFTSTSNALTTTSTSIEPYFSGLYEKPVPYQPKTLLQKFTYFAKEHPYAAGTGSFSFLGFIALFLVMTWKPVIDNNPSYARGKDEFLITYNKEGQELWRKHIGIGYDIEKFLASNSYYHYENFLLTADIDHDGTNEVIADFGWMATSPLHNTIVCFESDGKEKWKYEFHRTMTFGKETFADDYRIDKIIVKDFDNDGSVEIVAKALHNSYYACALFRLDANTGLLLNEYWHSGHLSALNTIDIDSDGKDEIVFGGANNGYNVAVLGIASPQTIRGHSPSKITYIPQNQHTGNEQFYILLPRTDLQSFASQNRNMLSDIKFYHNGIEVLVMESLKDGEAPMHFHFDFQLRCTKAVDTDWFVVAHKKLEAAGKLKAQLNSQYWDELRQNVRYWDGEKFMNEPTKVKQKNM